MTNREEKKCECNSCKAGHKNGHNVVRRIMNTLKDSQVLASKMIFAPTPNKNNLQEEKRVLPTILQGNIVKTCPECQFEQPRYPHEKSAHQKDCSRNVIKSNNVRHNHSPITDTGDKGCCPKCSHSGYSYICPENCPLRGKCIYERCPCHATRSTTESTSPPTPTGESENWEKEFEALTFDDLGKEDSILPRIKSFISTLLATEREKGRMEGKVKEFPLAFQERKKQGATEATSRIVKMIEGMKHDTKKYGYPMDRTDEKHNAVNETLRNLVNQIKREV